MAEEIGRLRQVWYAGGDDETDLLRTMLGEERLAELDRFDQIQLAGTIKICRQHASLSAAGRALFSASRTKKAGSPNDADRLRKYFSRFGLDWATIT
ncbi:hypothetical protein GCM10010909_10610 [Acidocella aquatica]|uniref:Transcriptional regulator n=1 Tax=Acidocella aquatica TaxID=1922313 RepID=A0ABQ6A1S2_9PROT|nr:hypothetical protein [Acidocella aquatica]GLR66381.1 hypothetical protein GCM10010909_10610 [Acidocella aquatica]